MPSEHESQPRPPEQEAAYEFLDYHLGLIGDATNETLAGYNRLPKEQQLQLEFWGGPEEQGELKTALLYTESSQHLKDDPIVVKVLPVPSRYVYESESGERRAFATYAIMDVVRKGNELMQPLRILCKKPEEPTVLFIQQPTTIASRPEDVLAEHEIDPRELLLERFAATRDLPEPETFEELLEQLEQERHPGEGR